MTIRRLRGPAAGRNQAVAYGGLVWTVGSARDTRLDLKGQTRETLENIEKSLRALGSDKTRLLSAQVFITDMSRKAEMDEAWNEWVGPNPEHWPLAEMQAMMKEHLDLTLEEAVAQLDGRYQRSVEAYDEVHVQILGMADMLSEGIVAQFPLRFSQ